MIVQAWPVMRAEETERAPASQWTSSWSIVASITKDVTACPLDVSNRHMGGPIVAIRHNPRCRLCILFRGVLPVDGFQVIKRLLNIHGADVDDATRDAAGDGQRPACRGGLTIPDVLSVDINRSAIIAVATCIVRWSRCLLLSLVRVCILEQVESKVCTV